MRLSPGPRCGEIIAPPSKSVLHRLMLLAAGGERPVRIKAGKLPEDAWATLKGLRPFCREIGEENGTVYIEAEQQFPRKNDETIVIDCGESATALHFLMALCAVCGQDAYFRTEGRLASRPHRELVSLLSAAGYEIKQAGATFRGKGKLRPGSFTLSGGVSSQYASALLLTLPFSEAASTLTLQNEPVSAGYISLSEQMLELAGIRFFREGLCRKIPGGQKSHLPEELTVEGDYSGAAAFLAMGAASERGVTVRGLAAESAQGDREILDLLRRFGADVRIGTEDFVTVCAGADGLHGIRIEGKDIPDLVPVLAVLAGRAEGESLICGIKRLRHKESDRLTGICGQLKSLGIPYKTEDDSLRIFGQGKPFQTAELYTQSDHRLVMSAALAAAFAGGDIMLDDGLAAAKSYPDFWRSFKALHTEECV